jgi:hypothetical protein
MIVRNAPKAETNEPPPYEKPDLGEPVDLADATLFSGTINPDAGIVDFGDG